MLDETLRCCESLLDRCGIPWGDLSRILLVGGSSQIPLVSAKLAALAQGKGARHLEICWRTLDPGGAVMDPIGAVAFGAALEAGRAWTQAEALRHKAEEEARQEPAAQPPASPSREEVPLGEPDTEGSPEGFAPHPGVAAQDSLAATPPQDPAPLSSIQPDLPEDRQSPFPAEAAPSRSPEPSPSGRGARRGRSGKARAFFLGLGVAGLMVVAAVHWENRIRPPRLSDPAAMPPAGTPLVPAPPPAAQEAPQVPEPASNPAPQEGQEMATQRNAGSSLVGTWEATLDLNGLQSQDHIRFDANGTYLLRTTAPNGQVGCMTGLWNLVGAVLYLRQENGLVCTFRIDPLNANTFRSTVLFNGNPAAAGSQGIYKRS